MSDFKLTGVTDLTQLRGLAVDLNIMRERANALHAVSTQDSAYGHIANALKSCLSHLLQDSLPERVEYAYQALLDGSTMDEAIAHADSQHCTVTYPVGTPLSGTIHHFDRSTKVVFGCSEHVGPEYATKGPGSSWFPANEEAREISDGLKSDPCPHTARDRVWVTTREYTA